jgi:hypothetical protein
VGRKVRSPSRTISNRGNLPRFIGHFPCAKAPPGLDPLDRPFCLGVMPFDSLSSLKCGIYLEWRQDVVQLSFEPEVDKYPATETLSELRCVHDYKVLFASDERGVVEAKDSQASVTSEQQAKFDLAAAHLREKGVSHTVVYRSDLEKDGFIDTVLLLRRYGRHLRFKASSIERAKQLLASQKEQDIAAWRAQARKHGISIPLLYHLLYHQQLPLKYAPLQFVELELCQDWSL